MTKKCDGDYTSNSRLRLYLFQTKNNRQTTVIIADLTTQTANCSQEFSTDCNALIGVELI